MKTKTAYTKAPGKTICVLIYDYSIKGGAQRVATNVFNEMIKNGYKVIFVSVFKKHDRAAFDLNKDIQQYYLNEGEGHLIRTLFSSAKKFSSIIKSQNVSVIIAAGYSVDLLSAAASFLFRIPMIHWEHTSLENKIYNKDLVSKLYRLLGVIQSKTIIVLTEKNRKAFERKYHIKNKIVVIPNWVEYENGVEADYDSNAKTIITVGRADSVKGFDRLIKVALLIKNKHADWNWQIWGDFDNPYGDTIKGLVAENGLGDFISFKGTTGHMDSVYKQASIYVLTSYFEGLPMVLIEAKRHKLPLVSFDIETGPDEIIDDEVNGFLIKDNDINEMARKICLLIENKQLRIAFSDKSGNGLEKFNKEEIAKKWTEMLKLYQ